MKTHIASNARAVTTVALDPGDGVGPEISRAVVDILRAATVPLEFVTVKDTTLNDDARQTLESLGVLLKGPSTPAASLGGWRGAFANKRIFRTLPDVKVPIVKRIKDLTIVRENIEDTMGMVEHMQTPDVAQCRRLTTRPGSLKVHTYTFEIARKKGAKRVTCAHKSDAMTLTDGLFLETFYEVAQAYPDIKADDMRSDDLATALVQDPGRFDVIVVPGLQGDILGGLAAGLVGGSEYCPTAKIGDQVSTFEASHGPQWERQNQGNANPTGLLLGAIMMLRHIGLVAHARAIEDALNDTLEKMHRAPDLGASPPPFTTRTFTGLMVEAVKKTGSYAKADLGDGSSRPNVAP